MLSIGMLAAGDEDYYVSLTAESGHGTAREDEYYTKGGEPPGMWMGGGSPSLGLAGQVTSETLRSVLAGQDPDSGRLLISPAAAAGRRRPGLYLTFSAPKGVSLLGLIADEPTAATVRDAHRAAVSAALGHIEREALCARRGHEGAVRIATGGFVAAGFEHTTSRAGDPQLHTHALAANLVQGIDGAWSAPDSRTLFRHARTAGFVYQAALRAELTARLGLEWRPVRAGMAEPAGIPTSVLREFSTRRRQIEAHLERTGTSSGRSAQIAATATRAAKDHAVTADVLRESWRVQAESAGFDLEALQSLCREGRSPSVSLDRSPGLIDELLGSTGVTAHSPTFDRRDLLRALAEKAVDGATPATIEACADRILADSRVVAVTPIKGADDTADHTGPITQERNDGVSTAEPPRWTTTEMLEVESAVLTTVLRRQVTNPAPVGEAQLTAALGDRPSLTTEQAVAVSALTIGTGGVAVLVGRAGTGKTFALDAARAAWESAGHRVIGAAPSARAAAELQAGSGIASTTLARLLLDAGRAGPDGGLPAGGVVVVDEAGMAGTRTLHQLLEVADRHRTKVVLVGDPDQLPEIEAGGTLRALAARLSAPELVDNRRQVEAWERDALVDLRAGQSAQALAVYRDHGRLVISPTAPDAHRSMVSDWWQARDSGASAAMFALRRADVDHLNALARAAMAASGALGQGELTAGGRSFAVGDEVVSLRNDRALGVLNGTRATIAALDLETRSVTLALSDGTTRLLPANYLDDGHLDHSYAVTLHKGQGATFDRAFLLGSDTLFREAGYVGLSRGRHRNDLYIVAASDDPELHAHGPQRNGHTDPVVQLSGALARSRSQTLATDTGASGPGPAHTLAALHALSGNLAAGATGTTALHRAVDERRRLLARAALADPGPHLIDLLGPPPTAGLDRARWTRAAEAVEAYRDRWQINDRAGLGPEPADVAQRLERDHARQLVDDTRLRRGLEPIHRDREMGLSR